MKNTFTTALLVLSLGYASAQSTWVNIQDPNFAKAIKAVLPEAVNESLQLDTSSADVKTLWSLNIVGKSVNSVEGLHYFKSLEELTANNNSIGYAPTRWPSTLENLYLANNNFTVFPSLPAGLKYLDLANNYLSTVPQTLPSGLVFLRVQGNSITALPNLSTYTSLQAISIGETKIKELTHLPASIVQIEAAGSQIRHIDKLPDSLQYFYANNNHIEHIEGGLPSKVVEVNLESNDLEHVPNNNSKNLVYLNLDNNKLVDLIIDNDEALQYVSASYNSIVYLPKLPPNAESFYINHNLLTALPEFISYRLKFFEASYNYIKFVPDAYFGRAYTSFIARYNCIQNHKTAEFWHKFGYEDSPNRENCDPVTSIGHAPLAASDMTIYPNPTIDEFKILGPDLVADEVKIINDQGREFLKLYNYAAGTSISLKDAPQGIYFALFKQHDKITIKKIIKE